VKNRDYTLDLASIGLIPKDLHELEALFTEEEVWRVIQELPPDRAPGPDGFIGCFYQKAWGVIKGDVMAALLKLGVGDGRGFAKLNRSLITLIPKRADALEVGDFRPICLVHSFGKLFSKILANRLRNRLGELVSMNQSAFIRGRCLHDNFLLVRQVARKINSSKLTGVFLKLDISRAFDSLSWSFLFEVLRQLGFGDLWCKWVALLLNTASVRVLVNGVPGKTIQIVRGLRQGDPTSPQLFVLAMEALTLLVVRAAEDSLLSPLSGCTLKQRVSIYADDVALFLKPQVQDLVTTRKILEFFGEASGLRVNYDKSSAILIRGDAVDSMVVKHLLQCKIGSFPCKYLGLQLTTGQLKKVHWQPILDQVIAMLPAWQKGLLQRQGRLILIKAVVTARLVHQLLAL
jgi:mannosylglycoprotein endo-beta-mannosidase